MKILALLFFLTAIIYSSVGFGGGSTYTALLVLFDIDYRHIPVISLCCNIIVVSTGSVFYLRQGLLDKKLLGGLITFSIPMAFVGGSLPISEMVFVLILGLALLIASILLFIKPFEVSQVKRSINYWQTGILIGAPVGLLAGITGIGGGIFLAPILHLRALAKTRTIAATACLFILVNSLAGLTGQLLKLGANLDQSLDMFVSLLALPFAVLIGGLIGNRIALKYFNAMQLRRMTALLVFIVAIRLLVRFINY